MVKFKIGDMVTGADSMRKYEPYCGFYEVVVSEGPTNYGEPTIIVKAITPVDFYEGLQYEHHFQLANKNIKLLWGTK